MVKKSAKGTQEAGGRSKLSANVGAVAPGETKDPSTEVPGPGVHRVEFQASADAKPEKQVRIYGENGAQLWGGTEADFKALKKRITEEG